MNSGLRLKLIDNTLINILPPVVNVEFVGVG